VGLRSGLEVLVNTEVKCSLEKGERKLSGAAAPDAELDDSR